MASEWSDGYVNDIGYTYGYYGELNPMALTIPFLMAEIAPPKVVNACELGFGQGMSVNAHACASDVAWHATDFNPAHVSFAKEIADISGGNVELFDDAFADFCHRDDLPDFDFIGLHGIWSWISDENRAVVVDFIKRKLKVGGVLYISYNTLPGWSAAAPIRHMMAEHAHVMGSQGGGSLTRVANSVEFTQSLISMCHSYQASVPSAQSKIDNIAQQNPNYLAHEYFNRDWHPMYFSKAADLLTSAKLDYACSSSFSNDFSLTNYTEEQITLLQGIDDPLFKETTKDFLLNTQFRKDYWIKGARKLDLGELRKLWLPLRFIMVTTPEKDSDYLSFAGAACSVNLMPEIYEPLIEFLSDNKIHTVEEIMVCAEKNNIADVSLFQSLAILYSKEMILLVQTDEVVQSAKPRCDLLNMHILESSLNSHKLDVLMSPLTGGTIGLGRIDQMFLHSYLTQSKKSKDWTSTVWTVLAANENRLIADGKTLESEEENITELTRLAKNFEKTTLPYLRKLLLIK